MKSILAFLLISSFAGIALFGAFAVHNVMAHEGYAACFAAISRGMSCLEGSPFASASFHFNILKGFSEAIPSALLLLLIMSAGLMRSLGSGAFSKNSDSGYVMRVRDAFPDVIPSRASFVRWLSLHTNSPSFA